MANDVIKIPFLNPLRFHNIETGKFACETIPDFESQVLYLQKFSETDTIKIQFLLLKNKYFDQFIRIYDSKGNKIGNYVPVLKGEYGPLYDVFSTEDGFYEFSADNIYYIVLKVLTLENVETGKYTDFVSEPFVIISETDNTINITYTHNANRFDVAFFPNSSSLELREIFQLRIEGGVPSYGFSPESKDTFYIDQPNDTVMLNSIPFNTYKFLFGGSSGIPNWMVNKLNMILSLSDVTINGHRYVKSDGSKLEPIREKGYPYAAWQIEMIAPSPEFSLTDGSGLILGDFNNDFNNDYL
jgi:hypothetical protein